ncbi:MAG: Maf family nucleotide pyrophosphatase [Crocinitomicaceae bacterium]
MLDNLSDKNIILASKSPRRQALLKGLDIDFEIRTKDIEEVYPQDLAITKVPEYLSKLKADAFKEELKENDILITSDTVVILGDKILEKPRSEEEAKAMIRQLSGKTHTVITAVCMTHSGQEEVFSDHSQVTFCKLSEEEITYYIQKYKPFDKAGAYGVQEWIGYIAMDRLEGSYFTVMGLPLHKVYHALKRY